MRSRTSYFNLTLFRKTLCRFWPVWAVYALVWVVALPMGVGGSISRAILQNNEMGLITALRSQPLELSINTGVIISVVFCCFSAMAVYSHLYSPRSAGAYASLPMKREGVFASVTLAGIAPLLAVNLLIFAATAVVEAASGAVYMPALWGWLGSVTLQIVFFFGFAALCAQLTGSLLVLPFVYIVLNFTAYAVEYVVSEILNIFVYGFAADFGGVITYFSPVAGIYSSCSVVDKTLFDELGRCILETVDYSFQGWGVLGVYGALGLALLVCSALLYRRRRMESAGDVVAVRVLRPVFKYCMALGFGLCLGLLLYTTILNGAVAAPLVGPIMLLLLMLISCFIGYFAAEMLIKKSFRVFTGSRIWLGFAASCAVLAFFVVSFEADLWGYERRVPDAGRVQYVTLNAGGESVLLKQPENIDAAIALHGGIIGNKALHEAEVDAATCYLMITYYMNDSSNLTRRYELALPPLAGGGDVEELERLVNTDEAIQNRKATGFPITAENIDYASVDYNYPDETSENGIKWNSIELTSEEANEFYYECIVPDISDGALGRIWLIRDDDYTNTVYDCNISIECTERGSGRFADEYQYFYTVPTVDSLRTNAWLEEHGVELATLSETGSVSDMVVKDATAETFETRG